MRIIERRITLNFAGSLADLGRFYRDNGEPVRLIISKADGEHFHCDISILESDKNYKSDFFSFVNTPSRYGDEFRVALMIPTGLGASVGGHAGDAGATSRLLASVCDTLVTHPNVVNASDINEMTDNTFYVEGYAFTEHLMGKIGLQKVRQNRVLVILDGSADDKNIDATINIVNAARATYGLNCPEVIILDSSFRMKSMISSNGRAIGIVDNLDELFNVLRELEGQYDAVALASLVNVSQFARDNYYHNGGVNPWGGVEAMLTHAISSYFRVPCAHSPMMESDEVAELNYGVIDPRDGAEVVSLTYFPCVLKGLNRAPQLCEPNTDVSCLVTPRMCLGLPALAAHERGIPIIAVNDSLEVEAVNCTDYVSAIVVDNYIEAAGIVSALRAGINIESLRRPLEKVKVSKLCMNTNV